MFSKNSYFQQLNQTLQNYHRAIPSLIIDLDRLDHNINTLNKSISNKTSFRIVVKSLPSPQLIEYTMKHTKTNRLMVFHQPFLTNLSHHCNDSIDFLWGKPMPIKTAAYYYNKLSLNNTSQFNPFQQVQWLVDTPKRVSEYIQLAEQLGQPLRLNLEIDVGLHRGGFDNITSLAIALKRIHQNSKHVTFSGFMGYDPHVVKLPKIVRTVKKSFQLANDFYQKCIQLVKEQFPELWSENLTLNGAGSPTIGLHHQSASVLNDVSAGSCLVKPTTFDIPTLSEYQPACFIATPILKKMEGTKLPGLEGFKRFWNVVNKAHQQTYFIYGGFWKADYCWPEGIRQNAIFGPSTNQTMLNAPNSANLEVDDFVFLRPHQSEFVFLQFESILAVRGGDVVGVWQLL